MNNEDKFMNKALCEEKKAYKNNEIPVGAIIVRDNIVLSRGYNLKEKKNNVLKHAELIAIEKASKKIGDWRLNDCVLYTTLFPCPMCASAIQQSRIKKVVYLNDNPNPVTRNISLKILNNNKMNHQVELIQLQNKKTLFNIFFKKMRIKSNVSRETLDKQSDNK